MKAFTNPHAALLSHEVAGNRVRISGTLILEQPLHIGSGRGTTETDSAVVRDHADQPTIPGSSLRGALRSRCERLADALLPGQICFLYEANSHVDCVSIQPDKLRTGDGDLHDDATLWKELSEHLCPSCRVFGAGGYWASKVRVPDLTLLHHDEPKPIVDVRHGVGIHRDTQTAAPAIKYDQEIILRNARFGLEILIENPDEDDLSLLALGLADLAHGRLALGGSSSRGLGGCALLDGKVESVNLAEPRELVQHLATGAYPKQESLDAWLATQLKRWTED